MNAKELLTLPHNESIKCLELAYKIGAKAYKQSPEARRCIHQITLVLQKGIMEETKNTANKTEVIK